MTSGQEAAPDVSARPMKDQSLNTLIPAWVDGHLRPMEKLSVHLDGIRHQAVSVFLMRGHEILIQ